jgi:polar amino acid transport system substrate-binding protein
MKAVQEGAGTAAVRRARRIVRGLAGMATVVATTALVSACGGSSSSHSISQAGSTAPAAAHEPALFSQLPAAIRNTKTIRLATEVGYAPYEVYAADGQTLQGLDVDLWNALAPLLGVSFKAQDGTYADIIPALESHRADVGWSAMALSSFVGLTQAKFLIYEERSFSGLVVSSSNDSIKKGTDLCGKSLGYTNGETSTAGTVSAECKKLGKPPIAIKRFQKTPDIIVAVESGQVDGRIVDSVNGNYFVKQSGGKLKFVPDILPRHEIPTGIAVPVGDTQLLDVLQKGLQELINNGTYGRIMRKWGAGDTTVPKISVAYKYGG